MVLTSLLNHPRVFQPLNHVVGCLQVDRLRIELMFSQTGFGEFDCVFVLRRRRAIAQTLASDPLTSLNAFCALTAEIEYKPAATCHA